MAETKYGILPHVRFSPKSGHAQCKSPCPHGPKADIQFLFSVVLVGNFLQPIDRFPIESFLNGNMCHRCGRGRTVPMLFARWKPNDISGANFFNWAACALRPSAPSRNYKRLTQWVCMPRRTRSRLKCDARSRDPGRVGGLKHRIDANRACEPI